MIRRGLAALVMSAALFSEQATAATVSAENGGTVLIRNGGGFVPIAGTAEAPVGTQIMVQPGGRALVRYPGGCIVQVNPGEIYVVTETPPCAGAQNAIAQPNGSWDTPLVVGGGVVIAAGIGLALALNRSSGPASP